MSESSLNLEVQSKTLRVNRGGDKKVMKKSLSVLVAGAMVSSMLASAVYAAETPLDTQAKYDQLVALGIFEGTGNGSELDAGMTREQLAKIVALLKKFPTPAVTSTGYTDVAADRWSAEEIAAVSKATPFIMDGTAPNVFNPEGTVTIEQLATVLVRALDIKVDASATVTGTVSDWAKANVAAVVKLGLLNAKTDYTTDAARSVLVDATYAAVTELAAPKVTEAVAVDSK
ncbi:MAG: S-layer protein, partial [Paenibacillus sp.]|nr:S-layer protein [Paenibacillus sp.]